MEMKTKVQLLLAARAFFEVLKTHDLEDHPQAFEVLDEYARSQGFMISASQRGVFGTVLKFIRTDSED